MTEALSLLEKWYVARCNGLWEHQHGVRIRTLDNPGWKLEIDLSETQAEKLQLEAVRIERTKDNWIHYWVEKKKFIAAMGPTNLTEAVQIFCQWFADSN